MAVDREFVYIYIERFYILKIALKFRFPDFPKIDNNRFQISVPRLVGIRHWELHLFHEYQILKRNFEQNGGGGASPTQLECSRGNPPGQEEGSRGNPPGQVALRSGPPLGQA